MNNQRHKRKESYSILLISNTGRTSRQFQLSTVAIRLLLVILLLTCTVAGLLAYTYSTAHKVQTELRTRLSEQEQLVTTLTAENTSLKEEQQTLTEENEALKRESEQYAQEARAAAEAMAAAEAAAEEEAEPESDSTYPSRYPSSGASVLSSSYSEEQPYLTITTYTDVAVASDDIYHHIIEIEHESGFKTRYLCHQEASVEVEEGAQVKAGDLLLTITADDTQMDYQVLNAEGPVDPLSVIDAKG